MYCAPSRCDKTSCESFDIVVTADFTGSVAKKFETRAIVFLAHWMENAGRARDFPLHLACIGSPPESVKWMAKKSNAKITIHAPHPFANKRPSLNKQRGFDVERETDHFLLLDTDVWVLSDISDLRHLGHTIAASPDAKPRVPSSYWNKIYNAFEMPIPSERICSIRGEFGWSLGISPKYAGQENDLTSMFPYYNAGIIYAPWSCNLSTRWVENAERIEALFSNREPSMADEGVLVSDQAAFAVTVQQLKNEGLPFRSLDSSYHMTRHHLYADSSLLSKTNLYHAIGFGNSGRHPMLYAFFLMKKLRREWSLQGRQWLSRAYIRDFWLAHTSVTYPLSRRTYKTYSRHFKQEFSKAKRLL